ncbi:hypothetical protein XENTR_v10010316 [Xenopus tropicalis]|uniref:Uncharacterized protein LOC100490786 n=1 Tax=Xenopus tropicalis TaxID=8364 RepID=A0A8J0QX72_XENTR|nr:uncharacterized protein LOC100490786 [Xenopus tropicalis]KAE8620541.1 hypothetical protein XENTR_v10010316 [Xenopus tropicalis]|eukprot:XP_002940713.2 PREDICTED: uncharacterized protein LOC100490786 [Xenopus tropicalis]
MSLFHWISSRFQTQAPSSSQLNLVNDSLTLRNVQIHGPVQLIANRPIVEECIEDTFQEKLSHLGGKENVLLVGEAGYDKDKNGPYHGILQELSFALFHLPERGLPQKNDHENWNLEGMKAGSSSSRAPSRMLQYPVVLVVFRATFILDSANTNLIREVLKDVRVRIKGSGSALVGIVYSQEELGTEAKSVSQMKFGLLIERIFQGYLWGICSYTRARPETILQVKRTIKETLQGKIAGQYKENNSADASEIERSFKALVCCLGGKERFLLVGNICSSAQPSQRAAVFKELSEALFEERSELHYSQGQGRINNGPTEMCTKLPKPKPFPYPLILVVFRSTFLREEANRVQVKEILIDIRGRCNQSDTQVIGVVCSSEKLEEDIWLECQAHLDSVLQQTFRGPVGVCSFVRSRPESVEGIKRCVCNLKERT